MFSYKSIPNSISTLRILLSLFFAINICNVFVYGHANDLLLMVTFPAIIVSDVMDGYLARKLNCTSITGAKLDVIADGVYVISSIATFAYFQVVPAWFVLVIVLKLSDFVITSRIMRDRKKTDSVLFFDKLGIFAIRAVMLLPGVFVFRCVIAEYALVMNITTYVLTAMIVVSSWRRMTVVFGKNKV